MIILNKQPGMKIIELGGGGAPHPASDINVDVRQVDNKVHFTVDFEKAQLPWPIGSDEFDIVYSCFCLEHINWRKSKQFLGEVKRMLKPGGKMIFITPNTEEQLRYILSKSEPDGDEGSMLFGDLNYDENAHKSFWSPRWMTRLLQELGFEEIVIRPFGQLQTDMITEAMKPTTVEVPKQEAIVIDTMKPETNAPKTYGGPNKASLSTEERAKLFDRKYFNGNVYKPFYWDAPHYEIVAQKILEKKPESVLELGCGRGYVGKRIEDAGIPYGGLDISEHCRLSFVSTNFIRTDLCDPDISWCIQPRHPADFCFSQSFWENVPEELVPHVIGKMKHHTGRGLHGIIFEGQDDGTDPNRCTIKPKEWWQERMPPGHEVISKIELESGAYPQNILNGDGRTKLNIGCAWTQFHHGWTNIDVVDTIGFSQSYGYKYLRHDVRSGLPQYGTGVVDLIYAAHFLEHLSYSEGLTFLRECRRVIRPDGAMRIVVPDAHKMMGMYSDSDMRLTMDSYQNASGKGLSVLDELNEGCANAQTPGGKLYSVLHEGHSSVYDEVTLLEVLKQSGWRGEVQEHRRGHSQILKETLDVLPSISLYVDAYPLLA